ncbi:MAG TPA: hypothetical protein VM818_05120 [Vicinamibacterales bacterium]|jgi:hypothetical protein|nr:hypothetical protein [Vicinamibacterales bacterium]
MSMVRAAGRWAGVGALLATASYAVYVGRAWLTYGRITPLKSTEANDEHLDSLMPSYDVVERHSVRVAAPAETTFQAAVEMDLQQSPIVRAIFKSREWIMGSQPAPDRGPGDFIEQMTRIGWGMLAEVPGREIVMGAVTQPWLADVVFRPLSPDAFATFREPDYVKIAWTLRADPVGSSESIFRTETRVATTDRRARAKFRRYWAFVSPGIILIRRLLLAPLKAEAERRARTTQHA